MCEIHTHIRESRRWFSVQRSQRGVAGTISLEIPGQASARPTSSEIGSLVLVCSAIMPCTKSRAVCSRELERMATELRQKWWIHHAPSGGTRYPKSTRNRPPARYRHAPSDRTCVLARTHILHALVQRAGHPRLTASFRWVSPVLFRAYLRRDRLTIYDGFQRSADQTDPNPPEPHRRPSQSPQRH